MKNIFSVIAGLLLTASVYAQAPQKMSYQAVIRNNGDALVTSSSVGMKISILQGSAAGPVAYSETQFPSTNDNGLLSLEIGSGTPVFGTFAGINWAAGPYFIKTETDPNGGSNYSIAGTSQLMSVPYALFSANGTPGPAGPQGPMGLTGATGATGPQGPTGLTGATGATGPQGPTGLTGAAGPAGPQGPTGLTGATGPAGPQGPTGLTGATGPAGPQGLTGLTGAAGPSGPQGPTGLTGAAGATGPQGPPGAANANGTINYLSKFTPNGVTLGNSQLFDNGSFVGIGTNTPSARLEVSTNAPSGLTAKFNAPDKTYLGLYEADAYRGFVGSFYGEAPDVDLGSSAGSVHLVTGNSIDLTAKAGDIGIGTTSPEARLDVSTIDDGQVVRLNAADQAFMGFWENNGYRGHVGSYYGNIADVDLGSIAGAVHLVTGTSIDLTAKSGKIGIGTEDPLAQLHIKGIASTSDVNLRVSSTVCNHGAGIELERAFCNTQWRLSNRGSSDGIAGNLVLESAWLNFENPNNLRDEYEFKESLSSPGYFRSIPDNINSLGTSTHRWSVVYAGNGVINTSDARDKTNITDINYGLADVMKLRPVSFKWNKHPNWGTKLGLIAQEVNEVVKEVVVQGNIDPQLDENGNVIPDGDKYGIYYSDLIPVLIKATQEQQLMIDDMRNQIDELKRQIGDQNKK
ncbi:MAG: tail fiber domain-containing protein [Saprospiraceae bacterium]